MAESLTLEKSKEFAIRIVKLHKYLRDEKHEFIMSKQLLRCGTSVGANLSEALNTKVTICNDAKSAAMAEIGFGNLKESVINDMKRDFNNHEVPFHQFGKLSLNSYLLSLI